MLEYQAENAIHRMKVMDRRRDIELLKFDNELPEEYEQVLPYKFRGTHYTRKSFWSQVKLAVKELLP